MSTPDVLWLACGLVLVIEGLFPALNPAGWRRLFEQLLQLNDDQIRRAGLVSMIIGLLILWFSQ